MSLNLNLDVNDVNTILSGLAELPAKTSYDLINRVKGQAESQLVAQNTKPTVTQESEITSEELLTE